MAFRVDICPWSSGSLWVVRVPESSVHRCLLCDPLDFAETKILWPSLFWALRDQDLVYPRPLASVSELWNGTSAECHFEGQRERVCDPVKCPFQEEGLVGWERNLCPYIYQVSPPPFLSNQQRAIPTLVKEWRNLFSEKGCPLHVNIDVSR